MTSSLRLLLVASLLEYVLLGSVQDIVGAVLCKPDEYLDKNVMLCSKCQDICQFCDENDCLYHCQDYALVRCKSSPVPLKTTRHGKDFLGELQTNSTLFILLVIGCVFLLVLSMVAILVAAIACLRARRNSNEAIREQLLNSRGVYSRENSKSSTEEKDERVVNDLEKNLQREKENNMTV